MPRGYLDYYECQDLPHVTKLANKRNQLLNVLGYDGPMQDESAKKVYYEWIKNNCKRIYFCDFDYSDEIRCVCGQHTVRNYTFVYNPKFDHVVRIGNDCAIRVGLGKKNYCSKCNSVIKFSRPRQSSRYIYCPNCEYYKDPKKQLPKPPTIMDNLFNEFLDSYPVNTLIDKIAHQSEHNRCRKCLAVLMIPYGLKF